MNILITGGRAPSALYLTRLFAKAGHSVYVADSDKNYLAQYSRYAKKSFHISSPRYSFTKFVGDIENLLKKYNIQLVIPTCEEVFHISMAKKRLINYADIFCDNFEKLNMLHNKFEFINHLKGINVKYPKTVFCDNFEYLKKAMINHFKMSNEKVVLKPVYSRFSSEVHIIGSIREFNKFKAENISEERAWVIQEHIEGKQVCSYSVCNNGAILAYSDYDTVFTAGVGANVYFEYANNDNVRKCCQAIVSSLNFSGQIAFDFILDADGVVVPIECNPRTTSGVHLFGYDNFLEKAFVEKKYVEILNCDSWALKVVLLFKFRKLGKWADSMFRSKDVIYSSWDIKPALMQGIILMDNIIKALCWRKSLLEITTMDIEFDGKLNGKYV